MSPSTIVADLVARQSSTRDDTMSVPDQVAAGLARIEANGWVLGEVHAELDTSGRLPLARRKGLKRAVERVEGGQAHVIVAVYFDRLMRDPVVKDEVVDRVEACGGRVTTLDFGDVTNRTPMGWGMASLLQVANKIQALTADERTRSSKQRNIDKGVPPFPRITPAYERRADGTLRQHPVNGPLVAEACRMRTRGKSWLEIMRWLNEQGLELEGGRPITATGVQSMMRSKLLVGEIHFGDFAPNLTAGELWEGGPICDHATFRSMHKSAAPRGRRAKSERLLARLGVLVCATCDARMSVQSTTNGTSGVSYPYYRCGNKSCPRPAVISAAIAEETVRDFAIAESQDIEGQASAAAEVEAARLAAEAANEQLGAAIRTLAGLAGEAATRETLDALQAERDRAQAEHDRLAVLAGADVTVTTAGDWDALTLDERRDVIRSTVRSAVVVPGRQPDRITCSGYALGA